MVLVIIPFGWNNIWILFLAVLLPLALGLGLMMIDVVRQEGFQGGIGEGYEDGKKGKV